MIKLSSFSDQSGLLEHGVATVMSTLMSRSLLGVKWLMKCFFRSMHRSLVKLRVHRVVVLNFWVEVIGNLTKKEQDDENVGEQGD